MLIPKNISEIEIDKVELTISYKKLVQVIGLASAQRATSHYLKQ